MAEVVTWGVVQHVKAALARITVANGYLTDIGLGEIVDDRARLKLSDSPVLLIVCGDVEPNGDGQGRAVVSSSMDISIECAVPFVVDNAERVAHHARVDIMRALLGAATRHVGGMGALVLTGSRFDNDISAAATPFTLAQVTARAGLTETFSPGN